MIELVAKLFEILNLAKNFEAGYDTNTSKNGKMLIIYKGKKYFVKIEDAEADGEENTKTLRRLEQWK